MNPYVYIFCIVFMWGQYNPHTLASLNTNLNLYYNWLRQYSSKTFVITYKHTHTHTHTHIYIAHGDVQTINLEYLSLYAVCEENLINKL